MSQENIHYIITVFYMLFCLSLGLGVFSKKSFIPEQKNIIDIDKKKTIWDKLEILSKFIAALGALIYAINLMLK